MIRFIRRIGRLFRWMPVIWRNQTWDYQYTLNILSYSLEELADCLENGYTKSGPKDAKRIRYVRELIRRLGDSTAWGMKHDADKSLRLEETYWDEIWTTIRKHGQGWWD